MEEGEEEEEEDRHLYEEQPDPHQLLGKGGVDVKELGRDTANTEAMCPPGHLKQSNMQRAE